ncbi:MAG: hypothetical protein QXR97_01975 [Thermoproteota archaeon]
MNRAKHCVKVLKRDSDRRFMELEVDGEKVRIEKLTIALANVFKVNRGNV